MPVPPGNPATGADGSPAPSSSSRAVPVRHSDFDHLALKELRSYRDDLAKEETRIAYCRRVLQIQLAITEKGRRERSTDMAFSRALARGSHPDRLGGGRAAILAGVPADGLPPMPDLARVVAAGTLPEPKPGAAPADDAPAEDAKAAATLSETDTQLMGYQDALRERTAAATAELIARYRERPTLAVRALPLTPLISPRVAGY